MCIYTERKRERERERERERQRERERERERIGLTNPEIVCYRTQDFWGAVYSRKPMKILKEITRKQIIKYVFII